MAAALPLAWIVQAATTDYESAQRKIDGIQSDRLKPGARVDLTPRELNAYAEHNLPAGVRNARVQVTAPGDATGSALVDFGKVERSRGGQPGWLMSKLLDGERPVSVTAHIRSADGKATVDVERVQVSGLEIDGAMLDFLIKNVLLAVYPDAVVGRPFELGHHIRSIDVKPSAVGVVIGK